MPAEVYVVALVILAIVFIRSGIIVVPQGMEFTLEYFGRYVRTLDPGLHFIMPFVERVGAKVNVMEQVLDIPSQQVITRDNAMITADGVVFFQVRDAAKSAYEIIVQAFAAGDRDSLRPLLSPRRPPSRRLTS
jgi:regulator of protease activity HflC (stomatin/prohibitin superfamily)